MNLLAEAAGLRIEELLDALELSLRRRGRILVGSCPVHGGSGADAFNVYPEGHTVRGNWKCRSRGCHLEFKGSRSGSGTLPGLIWGVLSHRLAGWSRPGDSRVPFARVVDWLCRFLGVARIEEVKVDAASLEKKRFVDRQRVLNAGAPGGGDKTGLPGWPREAVLSRMRIPADYYLERGYSREILERYDVGLWTASPGREGGPIVGRVVVPVYADASRRRVVGVTARSVHGACPECGLYHDPDVGCPKEKSREFAKWTLNDGFRKEHHLYNWWFAEKAIRESGVVVLVEGPGDVWRLEEAGVRNAVALFGNELSDAQQVILERSGAGTVVLFPHEDEAGEAMLERIRHELGRAWRVKWLRPPEGKDVGDTTVETLRREVLPFLASLHEGGLDK